MIEDREQQLDQIIADFLQAQENGRTVSEQEVIDAHPALARDLREFFDDLGQMNALASPLAAPVISRTPVLGKLRYFGDYELLEEIARGGMGIVYKAKQTSLNRIVAVKLILTGHLASETDIRRFKTEAESAANLQHPHIVSVHEVGRYEGQSYFSMDYIDGKNLSEIVRDHPLPPKQAAGYVKTVAEAIHFAHQQGTLHRDLKPSNVLIDRNDRVQITDFGLAFREASDSGLTRTGQLLGTPSYMPPEQAQHKRGLIGPASDIYSMGAILYELLTGRPPFQADSAVETLRQVIETEPLSPRLLNPAVPKDLETICLKCLQKEPHKRYATAQEFADDLGRFLQGEPILARPVGRVERAWRWCRRNPVVAGLVATVAVSLIAGTAISSYFAIEANKQTHQARTAQQEAERLAGDLQDTIEDLNEKNTELRKMQAKIAELIGNIQNWETRDAMPPLIEGLRHQSPELREWSATVLGGMGDAAGKAVPQLVRCLNDPNVSVRRAVCITLGKIGPKASEAVPGLEQIVQRRDAETHKVALNALVQIDPESDVVARESRIQIQKLVDLAGRYDRETHAVRQQMIFEITALGPCSVPALREIIADTGKSSELRRDALWILANLGPKAGFAVPEIESLLETSDVSVREMAEIALLRVDPGRAAELGLEPHDPSAEITGFNTARGSREGDWIQLGGSHARNNAPAAENLPEDWNVNTLKNIKWKAELGSQSYGNLAVSNGKIYVGTNNQRGYLPRYPPNVDLGVLLCLDEKDGHVLWQYSSPKLKTGRVHDWPLQGICSTPYVEGDRLWFVSNRCEVVCLDTEGFYDGEDDGVTREDAVGQARWVQLFNLPPALHRNQEQLRAEFAKAGIVLPEQIEFAIDRNVDSQEEIWMLNQKRWNYSRQTKKSEPELTHLYTLKIGDGVLQAYPVDEDGETDYGHELFRAPDRLLPRLEAGQWDPLLTTTLVKTGVTLAPDAVLQAEADRSSWTFRGKLFGVERTFRLRTDAGNLVCEYFLDSLDAGDADVVWKFDMMAELGVSPHNMSTCAPTAWGDVLFICTSNGLDESHLNLPAPDAPSFIALNKNTAEVLWTDNSPGTNILHGQWSCPTVGVFDGVPQVIFPGGDGWLYSFHAERWQNGKPELLWKFDGNPKDSRWVVGGGGGRATRNNIIGPPVIYDGLLYFAMGQEPEHGEGDGILWCLDPSKRGDVSPTLVVDEEGNRVPHRRLQALDESKGEREIPNPNSAVVWNYITRDLDGDGALDYEEVMGRALASPVIKNDLLILGEWSGLVVCFDAKTGVVYWTYDAFSPVWGTPLVADGKIYVADEDGDVTIFRLGKQKEMINEIYVENSVKMMPVAANGTLYLCTLDTLYAIEKLTPPASESQPSAAE